jgi:hypothetical protein
MHQSYLAAVERNVPCAPGFATEPYEAAWAAEAIFYVRVLDGPVATPMHFAVDISPDGMRWVPHGAAGAMAAGQDIAAVPVTHFGTWLRLRRTDAEGATARVIVYLDMK